MKNKNILKIALLLLIIVTVSSCADVSHVDSCLEETPYGFWHGLWHGFVSPLSFIGSLFSEDIAMYGVNNNGGWYDFGFVLGAGILSKGGSSYKKGGSNK